MEETGEMVVPIFSMIYEQSLKDFLIKTLKSSNVFPSNLEVHILNFKIA